MMDSATLLKAYDDAYAAAKFTGIRAAPLAKRREHAHLAGLRAVVEACAQVATDKIVLAAGREAYNLACAEIAEALRLSEPGKDG